MKIIPSKANVREEWSLSASASGAMSSFSSEIVQPRCSSWLLSPGEGGPVFVLLLPHPAGPVRGRAGLLHPAQGRECLLFWRWSPSEGLGKELCLLCVWGMVSSWCVTRNSVPFCAATTALRLCSSFGLWWVESLWCVPLFHPLPVNYSSGKSLNRISSAGAGSPLKHHITMC